MVTLTKAMNIVILNLKNSLKNVAMYVNQCIICIDQNKSRPKYCLICFYSVDMPMFNKLVIEKAPAKK